MAKKSARRNTRSNRRPEHEIDESNTMEMNDTSSRRRRSSTSDVLSAAREQLGDRDYREIIREFISSPAVKYVAGGIATAVLTRLASNMSERYPEISNFIRENMDNLEGRLSEFRGSDMNEEAQRH